MFPLYGNIKEEVSLNYKGTYTYNPYPSVGYSVLLLHTYICSKYNLKVCTFPEWHVLKNVKNEFENIYKRLYSSHYNILGWLHLDYLFNNLEYIIIYKNISFPSRLHSLLELGDFYTSTYEDSLIKIIRINNQHPAEVIGFNKSFILLERNEGVVNKLLKFLREKNFKKPIIIFFIQDLKAKSIDKLNRDVILVTSSLSKYIRFKNRFKVLYLGNSLNKLNFDFKMFKRNYKHYFLSYKGGYRSNYRFRMPSHVRFVLLLKSFSPLFRLKINAKNIYPKLANLCMNGFLIPQEENKTEGEIKFDIKSLLWICRRR